MHLRAIVIQQNTCLLDEYSYLGIKKHIHTHEIENKFVEIINKCVRCIHRRPILAFEQGSLAIRIHTGAGFSEEKLEMNV